MLRQRKVVTFNCSGKLRGMIVWYQKTWRPQIKLVTFSLKKANLRALVGRCRIFSRRVVFVFWLKSDQCFLLPFYAAKAFDYPNCLFIYVGFTNRFWTCEVDRLNFIFSNPFANRWYYMVNWTVGKIDIQTRLFVLICQIFDNFWSDYQLSMGQDNRAIRVCDVFLQPVMEAGHIYCL